MPNLSCRLTLKRRDRFAVATWVAVEKDTSTLFQSLCHALSIRTSTQTLSASKGFTFVGILNTIATNNRDTNASKPPHLHRLQQGRTKNGDHPGSGLRLRPLRECHSKPWWHDCRSRPEHALHQSCPGLRRTEEKRPPCAVRSFQTTVSERLFPPDLFVRRAAPHAGHATSVQCNRSVSSSGRPHFRLGL